MECEDYKDAYGNPGSCRPLSQCKLALLDGNCRCSHMHFCHANTSYINVVPTSSFGDFCIHPKFGSRGSYFSVKKELLTAAAPQSTPDLPYTQKNSVVPLESYSTPSRHIFSLSFIVKLPTSKGVMIPILFCTVRACCSFLPKYQFCLITSHWKNPSHDPIFMWFVIKQNWNSARNEQHLGQCGTGDEATPVN